MKKIIGVLLIVLGLVGFVIGGVSFTTTEDVVEVGPVEVERQAEQTVPIGPVVSGVVVLAGISLLVIGVREDRS